MSCITVGEADCETGEESDCKWDELMDSKDQFINGLYDYCDPSGNTCSKCCLLYLTSTLKGDPCWKGIVRETAQFLITDGWDDRNVTKMLLKCEQLHDLDVLLASDEKFNPQDEEANGVYKSIANPCIFLLAIVSKYMFWKCSQFKPLSNVQLVDIFRDAYNLKSNLIWK